MSCTLYIFSPLLLPTQPPSHPATQPDSSAGLISRTHQPDSSAGLISRTQAGLRRAGLRQDSGRTQAGLRGQRSEVRGQRVRGSEVRGQGSGVRGGVRCQGSGVRVYQGSSGCITHHTTQHIHTPRPPLYPAGCCQFTAFTVC